MQRRYSLLDRECIDVDAVRVISPLIETPDESSRDTGEIDYDIGNEQTVADQKSFVGFDQRRLDDFLL